MPTLLGYEGLAALMAEVETNPMLRSALLLRTATTLRDRLRELPYETPNDTPVTIEAQDALLLLSLLIKNLG